MRNLKKEGREEEEGMQQNKSIHNSYKNIKAIRNEEKEEIKEVKAETRPNKQDIQSSVVGQEQ